AANLVFELVEHLVDRGVHVLARFVRVVVRAAGVDVDLRGVQATLAAELDLTFHRLTKELLQPPDLVVRIAFDSVGGFHFPEGDRDVHLLPPCGMRSAWSFPVTSCCDADRSSACPSASPGRIG